MERKKGFIPQPSDPWLQRGTFGCWRTYFVDDRPYMTLLAAMPAEQVIRRAWNARNVKGLDHDRYRLVGKQRPWRTYGGIDIVILPPLSRFIVEPAD